MDHHVLGYVACGLNLVSMGMTSIAALRGLSLVANGIFIAYGAKLGATPIVIASSIATCIHGYKLIQLHRARPEATF